ncbi:Agbl4 [Phodopus roborovskii]|uniref:Agbl4 protein n=1 Tax=Phodopus roborovskii TaxID=109678 RepID=A0AAU9ZDP0_PHORO|nr:Agbl4 [Phodopus roborovskii]
MKIRLVYALNSQDEPELTRYVGYNGQYVLIIFTPDFSPDFQIFPYVFNPLFIILITSRVQLVLFSNINCSLHKAISLKGSDNCTNLEGCLALILVPSPSLPSLIKETSVYNRWTPLLKKTTVNQNAELWSPDGYICKLLQHLMLRDYCRRGNPSPRKNTLILLICYPFFQQKTSLEFYIDIHAHSTMMNGFMYGNIFEDEERFQRQSIFPKLLCQNAEDFSYTSTSFNRDAVKAGTGRRFLGGLLDHTSYCYTLEVSFYSYIIGGTTAAVPYTEEAWRIQNDLKSQRSFSYKDFLNYALILSRIYRLKGIHA